MRRNRAICLNCMQVLESKTVHDFQSCDCGNFLDGGNQYIRVGGDMNTMMFLEDDEIPLYPVNNKGKKSIGRKETDLPRSLGKAIKRHAERTSERAVSGLTRKQFEEEQWRDRKDTADKFASWVTGEKEKGPALVG